ncbi:hypothetical protein LSTR_LSTR006011 [Laodelphax striatellus]|uniref:Cadherin domain-containing protein n=1 Tax=Laodelphax striatellus TaxID=195883 RepID=A0A482XQE4_LAOST|nr:hypothetical protein LSTR_LSTR006011 [Laodelphax striatellus]
MCSFVGVFLSLIYLLSTLSAHGSLINGGFHAVFRRIVARKYQSNEQSYNIQESNTFYDSSFRDDFAEVERSIGRILSLSKYSDEEFRFEKPAYNVTTTTNFIGLLTALKLITSLKNTVQYGLLTDDGLLYSDTKLKKGVYNFEVTADILDLQRHATANVTVNVTLPTPKKSLAIGPFSTVKIPPNQKHSNLDGIREITESFLEADSTQQYQSVTTENSLELFSYIPYEFSNNVAKEDSQNPFKSLWRGIVQQDSIDQRTNDRALNKELLEKTFSSQSHVKLIVPHEQLRYQRAIPWGVYALSVDEISSTTTPDNVTVTSLKIHEESLLENLVMSSFVLFVTTFGVVILLGSLAYFIFKRIKKCGDYSVDDDNTKYVDGHVKKEIIQSHPPSVFTIQKCYEDHEAQTKAQSTVVGGGGNEDDDVFIVDMSQMSTNSQPDDVYNTITLQTFTQSTPAITATLIGIPPPVSILSSSRRSSIVSTKKDGSMCSEEMGPNGEMRRKSVTFSDIVELYQIKGN